MRVNYKFPEEYDYCYEYKTEEECFLPRICETVIYDELEFTVLDIKHDVVNDIVNIYLNIPL